MGLFSRFSRRSTGSSANSENQPTTSQSERTRGSKIESFQEDRPNQAYAGELQDMDNPEFTRTTSFFQTNTHDQPAYKYLQASDVRRQVQQAPEAIRSVGKYPNWYYNRPPLSLTAQVPCWEYPIVPSPRNPSQLAGNYRFGDEPGPVRAFYDNHNRTAFDVGYHDKERATGPPSPGKTHPKSPFSLATYHPAPTCTDTSKLRR